MELTIGQIVHYRLTAADVERIVALRNQGKEVIPHEIGQVVPAIVVWPHHNQAQSFNGQAFVDGTFTLWLMSVPAGYGPGCWSWPPAQEMAEDTHTTAASWTRGAALVQARLH